MNMWILALVIGMLVIGGIFIASAIAKDTATAKVGCASCNGKCTAEQNCGIQGCGAVSGGSCGCRK